MLLMSIHTLLHVCAFAQVVAGAAAPGDKYKPVEVGEVKMDLTVGVKADGGSRVRALTVMIGDLPGFKVRRALPFFIMAGPAGESMS